MAIDLFWNNLTDLVVDKISETLGCYRRLEYIGLGKNRLKSVGSVGRMFERVGRWDLSSSGLEEYEEARGVRDQIVEKNKKLRALKKPEEGVPFLDAVSQEDGAVSKFFGVKFGRGDDVLLYELEIYQLE